MNNSTLMCLGIRDTCHLSVITSHSSKPAHELGFERERAMSIVRLYCTSCGWKGSWMLGAALSFWVETPKPWRNFDRLKEVRGKDTKLKRHPSCSLYLSPWPPTSSKSIRATHIPHLKNLPATHQTLFHSPSEVLETKQCRARRSCLCMLHSTVRRRSFLPKDLQKDLPTEKPTEGTIHRRIC